MSFCSNSNFSFPPINKDQEYSDDYDSDHSYSDLILDYKSHKLERTNSTTKSSVENKAENLMEEHVVIEKPESEAKSEPKVPNGTGEIGELLLKSQELISSVDVALSDNIKLPSKLPTPVETENTEPLKTIKSSRKSSERSEWSLFDDLQFSVNAFLPLQDVLKWSAQLLLALERLHLLGIICCNLQMKNLLINECGELVVTYMCNVIEKYDVAFNNNNDLTLAPEMHSFQPITEAVDWWSYGSILYEMLVGKPLKVVHPEGLTTYTNLRIPKYITVEGRSLLKQLLAFEPHERLGNGINGAEDIKSHPFFNSVVWDDLAAKCRS